MHRIQSYHIEIRRLPCEFHDGILTLRGQVSSFFLKQLAQDGMRSVAGVTRITNRIEVIPSIFENGAINCQKHYASSLFDMAKQNGRSPDNIQDART